MMIYDDKNAQPNTVTITRLWIDAGAAELTQSCGGTIN